MAMPLAVHRFTVDQYHKMGDAGVFHEDDRVELLDGQIVEMSPINPPHAGCVNRLTRDLTRALGERGMVSVQNPVVLGQHWEPQPDIAVLRPRADGYASRHPEPNDILLLIEVADSSLGRDRADKVPTYARTGVPEVWLVNLPAETIEVCTGPGPEGYRAVRRVHRGETLEPAMLPGVRITTNEILG